MTVKTFMIYTVCMYVYIYIFIYMICNNMHIIRLIYICFCFYHLCLQNFMFNSMCYLPFLCNCLWNLLAISEWKLFHYFVCLNSYESLFWNLSLNMHYCTTLVTSQTCVNGFEYMIKAEFSLRGEHTEKTHTHKHDPYICTQPLPAIHNDSGSD